MTERKQSTQKPTEQAPEQEQPQPQTPVYDDGRGNLVDPNGNPVKGT